MTFLGVNQYHLFVKLKAFFKIVKAGSLLSKWICWNVLDPSKSLDNLATIFRSFHCKSMSYFLENWEALPYLQMNMTSRAQNYLLDCFTVQIMITYKNVKTNRKKLLIRSGINFLINCEVFEIVEHCKGPWCPVET